MHTRSLADLKVQLVKTELCKSNHKKCMHRQSSTSSLTLIAHFVMHVLLLFAALVFKRLHARCLLLVHCDV